MDERERGYHLLKEYYDEQDMAFIKEKGVSVFGTEYGLYGSSGLRETFELFRKIHLEKRKHFIDLGSGDGRIALLASLFTEATGIEGDAQLHARGQEAIDALKERIPRLAHVHLRNADYTAHDLGAYDTIYIYADHNWPEQFQEKLLRECTGVIISLHNIYRPTKLPKGKTYWVEQVPYVTYPINVADGVLDDAGPNASS